MVSGTHYNFVVKKFFYTDLINLENPSSNETKFLESLKIKSFSYNNFYEWYNEEIISLTYPYAHQ